MYEGEVLDYWADEAEAAYEVAEAIAAEEEFLMSGLPADFSIEPEEVRELPARKPVVMARFFREVA